MYICVCHAVNERRIEQAAAEGVSTIKGLCLATRAGTCCGKCLPEAKRHLDKAVNALVSIADDAAFAAVA
jgi:bacterioferritin-associated ferredoxin